MSLKISDVDAIIRGFDNELWFAHRNHRELKLQSFFMNSHKRSNKIRLGCLPFRIPSLELQVSLVVSLSSLEMVHPKRKYLSIEIYICHFLYPYVYIYIKIILYIYKERSRV